jgi:hypothetical protein
MKLTPGPAGNGAPRIVDEVNVAAGAVYVLNVGLVPRSR